jgi:hypothetical protein
MSGSASRQVVSGAEREKQPMRSEERTIAALRKGGDVDNKRLLACGAAIGLFIGVMVGMSASPIVASVSSALIGVVAAYGAAKLGGAGSAKHDDNTADGPMAQSSHELLAYLAGLGVAGVLGIALGLYARTHHLLSPSPKQIVQDWREAQLELEHAQQVALNLYNTGLALPAKSSAPAPAPAPVQPVRADDSPPITMTMLVTGTKPSTCDAVKSDIRNGNWELAEQRLLKENAEWATQIDLRRKVLRETVEGSCKAP